MFKIKFNKFLKAHLRKRLSVQTMVLTFFIVIILSIISSYIQIYYENVTDRADLKEDLARIQHIIEHPIAKAIHKDNQDEINDLLSKVIDYPFIGYVELTVDEKQDPLVFGTKENIKIKDAIIKTIDLRYEDQRVGIIEIITDPRYLAKKIQNKIPLVIILNIFLAVVISICLMLLIHSIIIKHLSYLAEKTTNASINNLDEVLELPNRKEDLFTNELDDLVNSINFMRATISQEIENNNKTNQLLKSQRDFSNTLLNSCSLIICKLDTDYCIIDINAATTLMTGFLDFEVKGKRWLDIFVEPEKQAKVEKKINTSLYCNIKDLATTDQNENPLYLEWNFVPLYEENDLKYHIAFGYDITKLKDAQNKLEEANSELENKIEQRTQKLRETNNDLKQALDDLQATQKQLIESETLASLGSLVAGISHEINTPLGVSVTAQTLIDEQIKKLNKLLANKDLNEQKLKQSILIMTEANEILNTNLKQAAKLIKSFKQVAVDSSSQSLYEFNLKENLNQTLLSLSNVIKKEHLTLNIICDPNLSINSYPGALTQIYTNLIMNSAHHAYDAIDPKTIGAKVITIAIEKLENKSFQILYQDNGSGIKEEILPHIFEPFITTKRGFGGSGLGANIVYNLVNKVLLGKISCENLTSPSHGAKFTIIIPNIEPESNMQTSTNTEKEQKDNKV